MDFKLKRPCADCPFRTDRPNQEGWLGEDRAAEISDALTQEGKTFQCHKTLDQPKGGSHCAGALIMLEKSGLAASNQMIRMAERLRIYDRSMLDMKAPVFIDPDDFVGWHAN